MLALPFEIFFSFWSCVKKHWATCTALQKSFLRHSRGIERDMPLFFHALPAAQSILFSNQLLSLWIRLHWWQNWLSGSEHCLHFVDSQRWKKLHKLRCVLSLSLSLCLLPKHIIAVNKRAESECMCDLDVVMVYFPRLEMLPASSSSSLVLFLSIHNRRGSNFSRCHSAEAAPLSLSLAVRPVISFHASCKCFCCSDSG